jgi:hypothetical protein
MRQHYAANIVFGSPFLKDARTETFTTSSRYTTIGSFVREVVRFYGQASWFHPVDASSCSLRLAEGGNLDNRLPPTIFEWRSGIPVTVYFNSPTKQAKSRKSDTSAPAGAALTRQCSTCGKSKDKCGFAYRQWRGFLQCRICTEAKEAAKQRAAVIRREQAATTSEPAAGAAEAPLTSSPTSTTTTTWAAVAVGSGHPAACDNAPGSATECNVSRTTIPRESAMQPGKRKFRVTECPPAVRTGPRPTYAPVADYDAQGRRRVLWPGDVVCGWHQDRGFLRISGRGEAPEWCSIDKEHLEPL